MELINTDYEKIILGNVLIDPKQFENIQDLNPNVFYIKENRAIFQAMRDLNKQLKPIDTATVFHKLKENKELARIDYITSLTSYVTTTNNTIFYTKELEELDFKRMCIEASETLIDDIKQGKDIDASLNNFSSITSSNISDKDRNNNSMSDIVKTLFNNLDKKVEKAKTGIPIIDKLTEGGLCKKELTTIGAKSGVGKTAMALRIVVEMFKQDKNILIVSREMSKEQVGERFLLSFTGLGRSLLHSGKMNSEQAKKVIEAMEVLNTDKIRIDDTISTIPQIKKAIRMYNIDILIVDYVQLLTPNNPNDSRERQVADLSRELRNISLDYNINVIQLTQLADKGTENHEPHGETYCRESRAIYQDSNQVIYIHKVILEKELEEAYKRIGFDKNKSFQEFKDTINRFESDGLQLLKIILDKNRSGSTGAKYYLFEGSNMSYTPLGR